MAESDYSFFLSRWSIISFVGLLQSVAKQNGILLMCTGK